MSQQYQLKNPQLVCIAGPLKGKKFALKNSVIGLGSAASNDIVVPGKKVAESHATLFTSDNDQWVMQNKSEFGVLVNKARTEEKTLVPGDTLQIGELSLFRFDAQYVKVAGGAKKIRTGGSGKKIKPGVAVAIGIYLCLMVAAGIYLARDSLTQSTGGLTYDYVKESIEKTREQLSASNSEPLMLNSSAAITVAEHSDLAAHYYNALGAANDKRRAEELELLVGKLNDAFFMAWNLEQQARYREAIEVYGQIERMVPDATMPTTKVASWRRNTLLKKVRK